MFGLLILFTNNFFSYHFMFSMFCILLLLLFDISVLHTSASLTINENYDSDVRDDTETFLNKIVPEVGSFGLWPVLSTSFPFHIYSMLQ